MAQNEQTVRLVLGGDVMLGRLVGHALARHGPAYPLGPVAHLLRDADLALVNLECAITASRTKWPGASKAFYFGAPPSAIDVLTGAGIDLVSLANNHVLDFGVPGLRDTRRALRRHGIASAGAGDNIAEAAAPVVVERKGIRFGMVALCDHQADFSAQRARPGMAYLDLTDECAALSVFEMRLAALREKGVDWPILSLHWGPNMVLRPSARFRRLARGAIGMGWKILFGHSAHVYQGIEIDRGCPIVYAAGDLVDDYAVDAEMRNDRQLLFEMELTRGALRKICLHPVWIHECQARLAAPAMAQAIIERMTLLCTELGTRIEQGSGETCIIPK